MNLRLFLLAPICAIVISACTQNSPLLKDHENFVGTWKNDHSELVIKSSGEVHYLHKEHSEKQVANETISGMSSASLKAKISHFDSQSFSVGEGGMVQEFKIDQAPHLAQGKWQMSVNGERYTRQ